MESGSTSTQKTIQCANCGHQNAAWRTQCEQCKSPLTAGARASIIGPAPLIPNVIISWVFGIAAVVILAGFIIIPWMTSSQSSFGTYGYQHALYAPGLWLLPVAAIALGVMAYLNVQRRVNAVLLRVIAVAAVIMIFAALGWETDLTGARGIRKGTESYSGLYVFPPWAGNMDQIKAILTVQHSVVDSGTAQTGFMWTLWASVVT